MRWEELGGKKKKEDSGMIDVGSYIIKMTHVNNTTVRW
jgi:hypothetical protein